MKKIKKELNETNFPEISDFLYKNEIGSLSFVKPDHRIGSCPLIIRGVERDKTAWFFVHRNGFLAKSLDRNHHVNYHVRNTEDYKFLSIEANAFLVDDQKRVDFYWSPIFRTWFPGGKHDDNLALMKLDIQEAHLWESPGEKPIDLRSAFLSMAAGEPQGLERETWFV